MVRSRERSTWNETYDPLDPPPSESVRRHRRRRSALSRPTSPRRSTSEERGPSRPPYDAPDRPPAQPDGTNAGAPLSPSTRPTSHSSLGDESGNVRHTLHALIGIPRPMTAGSTAPRRSDGSRATADIASTSDTRTLAFLYFALRRGVPLGRGPQGRVPGEGRGEGGPADAPAPFSPAR